MSNTPILNLPVAVSLSGTEYVPLVQGDTTKRAQASLFDFTGGSGGGPQTANTVYAGPTSGAAAPPSFRAIVNADITGAGAALTRVDDTNVTLTLGGAPNTALVNAASITAGWTGTLSGARGGTGVVNTGKTITLGGNLTTSGGYDSTFTMTGATSVTFPISGILATTAGASIPSIAQGDTLYGSATNVLSALAKDINATRYLSNTGASNNPAWAQINLTNGVSGTLPIGNGGTGQITASAAFDALAPTTTQGDLIYRNASANTRLAASTSGYHLQTNGAGTNPTWAGFLQSGTGAVTRTWNSKATDFVTPQDFGAVGNGTTDDSAAFQAALDTGKQVWVPYTSSGYSFGTNFITVGTGQWLVGESLVTIKGTGAKLIRLTGYGSISGVTGFTFNMLGASPGSSALRFGTSSAVVWRVRLSNLFTVNCYGAIDCESHATNYIVDILVDDVQCTVPYGQQIYIPRSRGFMQFNQVFVDCTLSATPTVTWVSIQFDDFLGLELTKVDVVGQGFFSPRVFDAGCVGIKIDGTSTPGSGRFVWLNRVRAEAVNGPGIQIFNTTFLWSEWLESFSALGIGIHFVNCSIIEASDTYARGTGDSIYVVAGAHGIIFDTCSDLIATNTASEINSGSGLLVDDTTLSKFTNVRCEANTRYGIEETGTSASNVYLNTLLATNTIAASTLGTSSRVITGLQLVDGPASATDGNISGYDGATGTIIKDLGTPSAVIAGAAGSNGLITRTSASAITARTITGTSNEVSVANGTGVSGDPTLSLPSSLTFTGKTITGGTYSTPALITLPTVPFAGYTTPINLGITASVGASALTVSVTGADGNSASATNPVYIPFRSATAATGTPVWRALTAALSLTISSGSTLGTSNSVPFRIWLVVFDDASTLRLGAIQRITGGSAPTAIAFVGDNILASSTAEGGAGAADSAGIFYTGTAVTSKPYRIIGYVDYASGLGTVGTWASGPSTIQLFGPGVPRPGDILQRARGEATTATITTSTAFVDSTLSVAMTPTMTPNMVHVTASGPLGWTNALGVSVATLTRDSTDLARNVILYATTGTELLSPMAMIALDAPGSVSSLTYKVRIRTTNASNTATFPVIGSVAASGATIIVEEIMA